MSDRGFFCEFMYSAVDVSIVFSIILIECLDDLSRFLGCCCIVKIDEWFSVDSSLEYWKVLSDSGDVYGC